MAASPAPALKRVPSVPASLSGGDGGGGEGGAGAAVACTASPSRPGSRLSNAGGTPKRVSFQLPPPPSSAAVTAAGRLLQGSPGGGGLGSPGAARRPSRLSEAPGGTLPAALALQQPATPQPAEAADMVGLTHLPGVDSPQLQLRPLVVPGLHACRRWPSNDVRQGEGDRGSVGDAAAGLLVLRTANPSAA